MRVTVKKGAKVMKPRSFAARRWKESEWSRCERSPVRKVACCDSRIEDNSQINRALRTYR